MATTTTPQTDPTPKEPETAAALHTGTSDLRAIFTRNLRTSGIYIAFVVVLALFAVLTDGVSLSPGNITNIVLQYSYILVLAIGMVLVIIAGHIDLSVGSVVALTGAISAVLVIQNGAPWWVGMLAALGVGLLVGVWQGFWVAYVGIPAFIVTLAGMLLFRGLTLAGARQHLALAVPDGVQQGRQRLPQRPPGRQRLRRLHPADRRGRRRRVRVQRLPHPHGPHQVLAAGRVASRCSSPAWCVVGAVVMYFAWQLAHARGLPIVLIILAVLIISYSVISKRTVFGRQIYAIGGNLAAAQLSGVKVRVVNFWIFVNMGFLAAVAGVIYSSRSNGAQPAAGNMFELDAIAAVFIGGAAVTGGVGTVVGAMVGGLLVAVMSNGMQLMGVDQSLQSVVKGLVLLLAVAFDVYNKRRAGASR